MVICGNCSEVFRRVRGKKTVVWHCVSSPVNIGLFCDARRISEPALEQICIAVINDTFSRKDTFLATLRENIETVICRGGDSKLSDIYKCLLELQAELLKLANSKTNYEDVANEIFIVCVKKA